MCQYTIAARSKLKNFAPKISSCAQVVVLSVRNANIVSYGGIAARNSVSNGCLQWCGQECPHLLRLAFSSHFISFDFTSVPCYTMSFVLCLLSYSIRNERSYQLMFRLVSIGTSVHFIYSKLFYMLLLYNNELCYIEVILLIQKCIIHNAPWRTIPNSKLKTPNSCGLAHD